LPETGIRTRKRIWLILVLIGLAFVFLVGRLAYVQLMWGPELSAQAQEQWDRELDIYPQRGSILDCNGKVLAQSASSYTIAARPADIDDPQQAANLLAPILDMDATKLYDKLSDRSQSFVWIVRQLPRATADEIRALGISGLDFTQEPRRYYPQGSLAAQILGFTKKYAEPDIGLTGQEGLELTFDQYLTGQTGTIEMDTDVSGRELPFSGERYIPPVDGSDVVLTIDSVIQHFTEKAAADAMERYKANKVYAIVMEPKTGKVLAMANQPTYNPGNPPRELGFDGMQDFIKNFNCKDNMDPGSIFKIVTLSAGLDAGVVNENSTFYDPGYKIVDGQRISCWKAGGHGSETLAQGVQNSCNPVFMEIALGLGKDRFYSYIHDFGFGAKTGIEVSGEASGILIPQEAAKTFDIARIGFGQSISLTPIQMITAASAAVNGGKLMKPYMVSGVYDTQPDAETGEVRRVPVVEYGPTEVRQVISSDTSSRVRALLRSVVTEGSGKNAYIPGYRVGGKTGTAQKYGEDHQILQNKHISSFIGFAPADDPQVIVLFMVDEPVADIDFGSIIAAPYVKMILEDTLMYWGVPREYTEEELSRANFVTVPDVTGMDAGQAKEQLSQMGLTVLCVPEVEGTVISQNPNKNSRVPGGNTVLLFVQAAEGTETQDDLINVPDVTGLSIREANIALAQAGLSLVIEGNGLAVSQNPAPEESVKRGAEVHVIFEEPES